MARISYFNPRTHEECDMIMFKLLNRSNQFQSTHSRGVRRVAGCYACVRWRDFNPRTHEECDEELGLEDWGIVSFQSTHSRGVRRALVLLYRC